MNTFLKFSVELEKLVGRKWQMAPNRMFQQLTDKTKKKKKHRPFYEAVDAHVRRRLTRNFQKFSSDDGNESLQSSSPSLPHWIQHTSIRDENRDFGKSGKPLMKTGRGLPGLSNVANLIYSGK